MAGDEGRLVRRAAPGCARVGFADPVHVIDRNDAAKRCLVNALFHHLQQLVLDAPGGGIGDAEMPFFCWVSRNIARNPVVSGSLVDAKMVPAVSEA